MDCVFDRTFKLVICPLLAVTALVSFIQNVLFCCIVYRNRALHKMSLVLIVNLSISGILNSATVPVFEFIYAYYHPRWPLGSIGTNIQNSIWMFSLVLPFATVTCITIERYLATVRFEFYRTQITPSRMALVVFFIWIYSISWIVILVQKFTPAPENYYVWNVPPVPYYIFLGLHLLVPLILIPFLYWRILKKTRQSRAAVSLIGKTSRSDMEVRLAKTMAIVIACLYLVWLPVVAMEIVYNSDFSDCKVEQGGTVSVWITSLNGCVYTLIYCFRIKEARGTLIEFKNWLLAKLRPCCFRSNRMQMVENENHPYRWVEEDSSEVL